jgi:hypothetical protein
MPIAIKACGLRAAIRNCPFRSEIERPIAPA